MTAGSGFRRLARKMEARTCAMTTLLWLVLLLVVVPVRSEKRRIGLLFEDPSLVTTARQTTGKDPQVELLVEKVDPNDAQMVAQAALRLKNRRTVVLITPSLSGGFSVLESFSNHSKLPVISLSDQRTSDSEYIITIKPDLLRVALDLIEYYQWENFAYLYGREDGIDRLMAKRDLQLPRSFLRFRNVGSARNFLLEVLRKGPKYVLVDLEDSKLTERLITEVIKSPDISGSHFILTQPIDDDLLKNINNKGFNLTWFEFLGKKKKKPVGNSAINIKVAEANLVTDSLRLVLPLLSNKDSNATYEEGELMNRLLHASLLDGLTGNVLLNSHGKRVDYTMNVMNSGKLIMTWSDRKDIMEEKKSEEITKSMTGVKLKVVSILDEPYMMKTSGVLMGFCKDLLNELSEALGFEHKLDLVGAFGSKTETGSWTGMIGQVAKAEADLALGALTVTADRRKVVDFSVPFYRSGISLLVPRPRLSPEIGPGQPYFFLGVMKMEVWCCHLAAWLVVGIVTFALLRLTHDTERDIDVAPYWPLGPLWHTLAGGFFRSLAFQPRSPSVRLLTGVWWLYAGIYFLLYCGAVCSMLFVHHQGGAAIEHVERMATLPINQYLKEALKRGSPAIGAIANGSTQAYIQKSQLPEHKLLAEQWRRQPELLITSAAEGAELAGTGDYAFLIETAAGEYWRGCRADVLEDKLNERSFALALPKGSKHKESIDAALARMEEAGILSEIQRRWWNHTCPSVARELTYRSLYSSSLSLQDVGAIFYTLVVGVVVTFLVSAAEGCVIKQRKRKQTVSLTYVKRDFDMDQEAETQQTFL